MRKIIWKLIKNSQPSMQNRKMPVIMSEMEAGTWSSVCKESAPFSSTASRPEMATIAKGFNCASQATVMAVKPTPPATPS